MDSLTSFGKILRGYRDTGAGHGGLNLLAVHACEFVGSCVSDTKSGVYAREEEGNVRERVAKGLERQKVSKREREIKRKRERERDVQGLAAAEQT